MLASLLKPWFIWRPWQLVARVRAGLRPPAAEITELSVAWGATLAVDPTKTIGRCILTTGVYDLAVSEALARLISPGDTVVDAGANVGYMTVLAGTAAGPTGRVVAWEPHPAMFRLLERNVDALGGRAAIDVRNAALGAAPGTAELISPPHMGSNDGVSFIGTPQASDVSTTVAVETIDAVMGTAPIALMKIDVEGFEREVLAGASQALSAKRIRHIVFEDHVGAGSEVIAHLAACGYEILSLGWSVRGPKVRRGVDATVTAWYEAPNYIASLAPDEVEARCARWGWVTLGAGRLGVPRAVRRMPRDGHDGRLDARTR
jgi:FkbM family methyltransferase